MSRLYATQVRVRWFYTSFFTDFSLAIVSTFELENLEATRSLQLTHNSNLSLGPPTYLGCLEAPLIG